MSREPHTYRVSLEEDEVRTLSWLGERYETAEILCSHMELCAVEEGGAYAQITLPEHIAWDYETALREENGNPDQMLPTCVGVPLGDKLIALYLAIV